MPGINFSAARAIARKAKRLMGVPPPKRNLLAEFEFVFQEEVGTTLVPGSADPKSVNWVVPPFHKGSGGHMNIFRFVDMLERRGYKCCVVVVAGSWFGTPASVKQNISEWFVPLDGPVALGIENAPPAHICVATAWHTAYEVRRFRSTRHRCYFVQDFEPYFGGAGTQWALAEATYRFGFRGITAGGWLADKLAADYGMQATAIGFSYDPQTFFPRPRQDPRRRILFYGRPSTVRRAFELGFLALSKVATACPDVEVVFVGGKLDEYQIPFRHRCEGILDSAGLARLYAECDMALVLSMTNLSLLPVELMACGVPVVSNKGPCTEWLLTDENAQLVEPEVNAIATSILALFDDPVRRQGLRDAGLRFAAATSWEAEGERMALALATLDA